jgi:hypothetical protein
MIPLAQMEELLRSLQSFDRLAKAKPLAMDPQGD